MRLKRLRKINIVTENDFVKFKVSIDLNKL